MEKKIHLLTIVLLATISTFGQGLLTNGGIKSQPINNQNNYYRQNIQIKNPYYTGDKPYSLYYNEKYTHLSNSYNSQIRIKAPTNSHVIVIIKENDVVVSHAFIRMGSSYSFDLPNGTYQPFFYYGRGWDYTKVVKRYNFKDIKGGFSRHESVSKDSPQSLQNNVLTYTLILQENGNFRTLGSDKSEAF